MSALRAGRHSSLTGAAFFAEQVLGLFWCQGHATDPAVQAAWKKALAAAEQ